MVAVADLGAGGWGWAQCLSALLRVHHNAGLVEEHRIALVMEYSYSGEASAAIGLPHLDNPVGDAHRPVKILAEHGFEVISCDGRVPGCFDRDRKSRRARGGAVLALVFFASHGLASGEGNCHRDGGPGECSEFTRQTRGGLTTPKRRADAYGHTANPAGSAISTPALPPLWLAIEAASLDRPACAGNARYG
jgi:hypothetical protein